MATAASRLAAAPAPPAAAAGTRRPRPPETPERSAAGRGGRTRTTSTPSRDPQPGGGRPHAPCPHPPSSPRIGSKRGRCDPAPGPPPLGWRLLWKGGIRGGGDPIAFPTPNTAAARPLLEEAVVSGLAEPSPDAPQRGRSTGGTLETPTPPRAVSLKPFPGLSPCPKFALYPQLFEKGDSTFVATRLLKALQIRGPSAPPGQGFLSALLAVSPVPGTQKVLHD
ncbi:translation initiation factor IF-2-like [Elephas maximus indicus]|uniref:translation initiation factor IF-2-like n=1 Tax=Elephas maximus indicus TaxID=99487 RepID=UPI0021161E33|nr:translation initiation factor IF-2-like [Elephas maximus indicus]XP_049724887.1 translation initiation factor IF-2-like [Elephas maximus indicus]